MEITVNKRRYHVLRVYGKTRTLWRGGGWYYDDEATRHLEDLARRNKGRACTRHVDHKLEDEVVFGEWLDYVPFQTPPRRILDPNHTGQEDA